jgi:hypothetical protein
MGRTELFEIHDHRLFPGFLRDLVTDALQALWDFTNSYRPILPLLRTTLGTQAIPQILDLCSGGGGPWFRLMRDFEDDQNLSISVCLTDKYPNKDAFEGAFFRSNSKIGFDSRSIQAAEVPADLGGFRTMFSSFHHFRPAEARRVLTNAMERGTGIAIFEVAQRKPKTMLAICFLPVLILFLTPGIRPFRWSRLLWTYVLPVIPLVVWFDGWMSCLRAYSNDELSDLVRSLPEESYRWEIGTKGNGLSPVTYLIGCPAAAGKSVYIATEGDISA